MMVSHRWRAVLLAIVAPAAAVAAFGDEEKPAGSPLSTTTVGMPAKLDQVVIPGGELEVKPQEDKRAPFVLRIVASYPHVTAFRYDLSYYALEPGTYDLANFLRRKDGTATTGLPSLTVRVEPILAPGQVEPHALTIERSPWLGGYRLLIGLVGSLWCAGLAAILLLGRRKAGDQAAAAARPVTVAERIRPLVASALDGTLSEGQHAELERLLIGYWRKRLGLERSSPAETIAAIRRDPDAAPLLRGLEGWLHRPGSRAVAEELAALLRPYQDLQEPAEEAELPEAAAVTSPATPEARR
ncbi:hypothetical protein [Aquisphaera insulae]|uniref:hypothetical protein n=1 Tax=Aquisphaera insulae TaxID=2712864 RepID=UPI0013EB52D6|nr:hypothetical protein [Aquisphaera insulae]